MVEGEGFGMKSNSSIPTLPLAPSLSGKCLQKDDFLLSTEKAAAQIRARILAEEDYKIFEKSLKDVQCERNELIASTIGEDDENPSEMLIDIKDRVSKSRLQSQYSCMQSWRLSSMMQLLTLIFMLALLILNSILSNHAKRNEDEGRAEHWVEVISWEPRAFMYHNFLTKKECDYLIKLAKPHMHKSTVLNLDTGKTSNSRLCTGSQTFLHRGQDSVIKNIEKKIADFTFIPVEHGEGLQILHYEIGQKYEPHFDYFMDQYNTRNGGQRIATVLMYLSDVEEGGETVFPFAKGNLTDVPHWRSRCENKGLSVKPKMGDALLLWSTKHDGTLDSSSLHGSCPVINGNKWLSAKWLRVGDYNV